MYEFQRYNPAIPQIITSFKGNQKLILGGYRYNIHHVKEGVKTWRCVCAKKLTGARSWCKGRAETWDADSKGIPKGEHNHQTEHELAELEYFKSQLILAAISHPNADLNALIDEATHSLSDGLSFGNRESMKKSLIVARKSVENGEFKLGQHRTHVGKVRKAMATTLRKASATGATQQRNSTSTTPTTRGTVKSSASAPVPALSSAKQASLLLSAGSSTPSTSSFLLNSSGGSSGLGSSLGDSFGDNTSWLDFSVGAPQSDASDSAANGMDSLGASSSTATNEQLLAAALFAAAMLGNATGTGGEVLTQPQQAKSTISKKSVNGTGSGGRGTSTGHNGTAAGVRPAPSAMVAGNSPVGNVVRKTARVNGILNRLSTKAAEKSVSPSPPLIKQEEPKEEEQAKEGETEQKPAKKAFASVETQTEEVPAKRRRHAGMEEEGESGTDENSFNHTGPQRKVVCCCCCEGEELRQMPIGCKKRARRIENELDLNGTSLEEEDGMEEEEEEGEVGDDDEGSNDGALFDLEKEEEELRLQIAEEEEE